MELESLKERMSAVDEHTRRLEDLESQQQQRLVDVEHRLVDVEQRLAGQIQAVANGCAAALDSRVATLEVAQSALKRQLEEKASEKNYYVHQCLIRDLSRSLATLEAKLKQVPPLQTALGNPPMEALGADGAVLSCPGAAPKSKHHETTMPFNLLDAAGDHQLLPQVRLRGHHLASTDAVEEILGGSLHDCHDHNIGGIGVSGIIRKAAELKIRAAVEELSNKAERPIDGIQDECSDKHAASEQPLQYQHATLPQLPAAPLGMDVPPPITPVSQQQRLLALAPQQDHPAACKSDTRYSCMFT